MSIDFDALMDVFRAQTLEGLEVAEATLLELEASPDREDLVAELFRIVHTIKGDAGTLGLGALMQAAHRLEDYFDQLRSRQLVADEETVSLLLEIVDVLRWLLDQGVEGGEKGLHEYPEIEELLHRVPRKGSSEQESALTTETSRPSSGGIDALRRHWSRTMRVEITKLDQLITLAGELAVARGRIARQLESGELDLSRVTDRLSHSDQLLDRLQELVTNLRMIPLAPRLQPLSRQVRDLSAELDKEARLVLDVGEIEIDNAVVEKLGDPLVHLVRNAIDHGLETPEERVAKGKSPVGNVHLRARSEGSLVVLELSDDGRGIDHEAVLARAVHKGLARPAQSYSDAQVHALLFERGFSIKDTVTEVSGRGVGLDAVRTAVEDLRGQISIESRLGEGTTVVLKLPFSTALVEGLLVRSAGERFVVPIDAVSETAELPDLELRHEKGVFNLRGDPIPFARLRALFGLRGRKPERENVLVAPLSTGTAGLVVDAIEGRTQAVVRPLAPFLRSVQGISGTTVLGDGGIALLLDVPGLLRPTFHAVPGASRLAEGD